MASSGKRPPQLVMEEGGSGTTPSVPAPPPRHQGRGQKGSLPLRRALLVVGMHRSGTSALTRVLSLCGANLPQHLMSAGAHNPRGYFESQAIYELHEELLGEAGTSWDDGAPFPADWIRSPVAPGWIERMAQAVRDEFGGSPLLILKDPRMCRLVPFWLRVLERLEAEPCFVLPVRNPLDVAASLHEAQGTEEPKVLLLWVQHFLTAERDTRGFKRCLVRYDALLRDWRSVVKRISGDLQLAFPRVGRRAAAEIDAFLESELKHHSSTDQELFARSDVSHWVKDVYLWATRAAASQEVSPQILDDVEAELRPAEAVFGPLLASVELARERAKEEARQLDARAQNLEQQNQRLQEELSGAKGQVAVRGDDLARLRDQLSTRERQMSQLIEWIKVLLQWSSHVVHGGEATSANLEVLLRALDTADPGSVPQIATTGIRLAQQSAETARLAEEADLRRAEFERARDELLRAREEIRVKAGQIERLSQERRTEVERLTHQVRGLWQQVSARDTEFARLKDESAARVADLGRTTARVAELDGALQVRAAKAVELERELEQASGVMAERDLQLRQLQTRLAGLEGAKLWKLSKPLRLLAHAVRAPLPGTSPSLVAPVRRILKLVYWSVTFQLPTRLRERRAVQQIRESEVFDLDFYTSSYPDVSHSRLDPVTHYVRHGGAEGRDPSPLFDSQYYLECNPDVAAAGMNPLVHFLRANADEGRNPNPFFDTSYYVASNPLVRESGMNALVHYVKVGAAAGRDPSPRFDTQRYRETHPELSRGGMNPLAHFLRFGRHEGHEPRPGSRGAIPTLAVPE